MVTKRLFPFPINDSQVINLCADRNFLLLVVCVYMFWMGGITVTTPSHKIYCCLFVYTTVVAKMEQFSGLGWGDCIGLLHVLIVISTTENMLKLVPDSLREASYALGTPK